MFKISDKEIIEGVVRGNEKVIQYMIRSYFPKIKRFVLNYKGNTHDAEDVMQETLAIVFEKIRSNSLKVDGSFGTYLFGIVKIVWIKELKNRGVLEKLDLFEEQTKLDSGNIAQIEKRDRQTIYKVHFEKLGDDCKKLLQLFFNGIKIKDITQKMGYKSDQHTKNRKYICKKYLIENIRSNPKFKEVKNERLNNITEIPRW